MDKFLKVIAAWLFLCGSVQAQQIQPIILWTHHNTSGGASYTGPADVAGVTPKGFWGLRPMSASVASGATALFNMCTSSFTLCNDIHATASGGLNASDLATNSCNTSGTCIVDLVYDQSGNGQTFTMCINTFISECPTFLLNGTTTGKPTLVPGASGAYAHASITLSSVAVPYSMTLVNNTPTPNAGTNERLFVSPDPIGLLCCGASHWSFDAGNKIDAAATIVANTYYAVIAGTDGTATGGFVAQDGSSTGSQNAGNTTFGGGGLGAPFINNGGNWSELAVWGVLFNGTQIANVNSNMQTYWGI